MLRSAKNIVKGYSSTEILVRDATANNSTMPDRFILEELADKSYNSTDFFEIMDMLDKRINDKGKYWRHVLKSLVVLDFLVRFGSENCVLWCKENIYIIKTLREFMHTDESGVDEGKIIRSKAKALTSLLLDDERLRQERELNGKRRKEWERRDRSRSYLPDEEDEDLRRAIEESKITAEEEEARRKRNESEMEEERKIALQLSKEEQDLKRLQELQQQQQQQQQMQQMQQLQQPQIYYDIFGNPITPEEYLQFQQQQALLAQQQEAALQQQQYWALQQQQQQQAALLMQQQQQQKEQLYDIQQETLPTGSNNPFARNKQQQQQQQQQTNTFSTSTTPSESQPPSSSTSLQPSSVSTANTTVQQPLKQTRTGNQSITDKYSALNSLLATGAGIDTFGNTGSQRIPAQHTQTGTFINSQGTGYRQVTEKDLANPFFMGTQYTGLPSTNMIPSQTGYGFGNTTNSNTNNNNSNTLLDL